MQGGLICVFHIIFVFWHRSSSDRQKLYCNAVGAISREDEISSKIMSAAAGAVGVNKNFAE